MASGPSISSVDVGSWNIPWGTDRCPCSCNATSTEDESVTACSHEQSDQLQESLTAGCRNKQPIPTRRVPSGPPESHAVPEALYASKATRTSVGQPGLCLLHHKIPRNWVLMRRYATIMAWCYKSITRKKSTLGMFVQERCWILYEWMNSSIGHPLQHCCRCCRQLIYWPSLRSKFSKQGGTILFIDCTVGCLRGVHHNLRPCTWIKELNFKESRSPGSCGPSVFPFKKVRPLSSIRTAARHQSKITQKLSVMLCKAEKWLQTCRNKNECIWHERPYANKVWANEGSFHRERINPCFKVYSNHLNDTILVQEANRASIHLHHYHSRSGPKISNLVTSVKYFFDFFYLSTDRFWKNLR